MSEETRHPDLYFDDGNVLIHGRDNARPDEFAVFRVYRGLLERHSTVLRDILQLILPSAENIFTINLSEDSQDDLANMLYYIFDSRYLVSFLRRLCLRII